MKTELEESWDDPFGGDAHILPTLSIAGSTTVDTPLDPFGDPTIPTLDDFDFAPIDREVTDSGGLKQQVDLFRAPMHNLVISGQDHVPLGAQPWPPNLIFDLALGLQSTQEILTYHNISAEVYEHYLSVPAFRRELAEMIRLNQEQGISFSRRAAAMAEDCLPDMYNIAKDRLCPATTRVAVFRDLTRLGQLEPKQKDGEGGKGGVPQVNIQINL